MSFFGSTSKISELIQTTIDTLNKTNSLQPNTPENALGMYISTEQAINNLTILDGSLDDYQKKQFWRDIVVSMRSMQNPSMGMGHPSMGMQDPMGMGHPSMGMQQPMGMQDPMGMGHPSMGMQQPMGMQQQNSGMFGSNQGSGMFGSNQGSGMFGSNQGSGMFGSSGGMFAGVLQNLQQIKKQIDDFPPQGAENDQTNSIKVMSVQPILIQVLIQLNTLAMQLFPMAHPGKQIENILELKAACELGSGLNTRMPYSQQHTQYGQRGQQFGQQGYRQRGQQFGQQRGQQNYGRMDYSDEDSELIGGRRRRTRHRRRQRGGNYSFNTSSYGSNAAPVGGRRKRRTHKKRSHRRRKSCKH